MTRIVVTAAMIALVTVVVGCQSNQGRSQILPNRDSTSVQTSSATPGEGMPSADEIDLVEALSAQRQAYHDTLQKLIQYYDASGNYRNLSWARKELNALDRIPQYRYVVEAQVLSPDLKATQKIQAADNLYAAALETETKAGVLPVLKDEEGLRAALSLYGQLLRQYPTSDKIDDAAFRMSGIHEYFRDYVIALSFYQRAYQWDPATPYPARYKAAAILDGKLRRRAEALQLYQEALVKEAPFIDRSAVERRIRELTDSDKPK
ncbi:MAG: hypothetical protein JW955_09120 [Sedimentisphaerales bacterium]|nr:hypothetical protein [Sedimentisphaerales bacterium]